MLHKTKRTACSRPFFVLRSIASKPSASPLSPPPLRGCPEGPRGKGFPRLASRAPFGRPPASESGCRAQNGVLVCPGSEKTGSRAQNQPLACPAAPIFRQVSTKSVTGAIKVDTSPGNHRISAENGERCPFFLRRMVFLWTPVSHGAWSGYNLCLLTRATSLVCAAVAPFFAGLYIVFPMGI